MNKSFRKYYGNRKHRKNTKLNSRWWWDVWERSYDHYKGEQRVVESMQCKSSSIETWKKIDEILGIKRGVK